MATVTKPAMLNETGILISDVLKNLVTVLKKPDSVITIIPQQTTFPVLQGTSIAGAFPECVTIDFNGNIQNFLLQYGFQNAFSDSPVIIELTDSTKTGDDLKHVTQHVTKINGMFCNCSKMKELRGYFDCTSINEWSNAFNGDSVLEKVTIIENTIKVDCGFKDSPNLTQESLISVANGLDSSVSGKTLTLHATPKASCASIMGTNNDGLFVEDAQGTLSLADFITTVKGWTLS